LLAVAIQPGKAPQTNFRTLQIFDDDYRSNFRQDTAFFFYIKKISEIYQYVARDLHLVVA
jgi:hypothetical protein